MTSGYVEAVAWLTSPILWIAVVAVANLVLVGVTVANLRATSRAANAASISAAHGAIAANSAKRIADAIDSEAFAAIPIIVATQRTFIGAKNGGKAQVRVEISNLGRGTALNLTYRLGVLGRVTDWVSGKTALPCGPTIDTRLFPWPEAGADAAGSQHWFEVRYFDQTGRRYSAVTEDRGVTVSRLVRNGDGSEREAGSLISYPGAFG